MTGPIGGSVSFFSSPKEKKMAFRQACTQKHVYNRTARCGDASANDRVIYICIYISGWISIFIPFADGTAEKRVDVGVRKGRKEGRRGGGRGGRVRNASGLTSRFDAMQTAPANYPQSPPFSDFMPIVYADPCARQRMHIVYSFG